MVQLILMRHATRASLFPGDSPLNEIGLRQASLAPLILAPQGALPPPTQLLSSPKLRARQTLQPLATRLNLAVQIDERLDERANSESLGAFENRVRDFIRDVAETSAARTTLICSHMDWLETVLPLLPSDLSELEQSLSWNAGEFKVFEIKSDGHWIFLRKGILPRA